MKYSQLVKAAEIHGQIKTLQATLDRFTSNETMPSQFTANVTGVPFIKLDIAPQTVQAAIEHKLVALSKQLEEMDIDMDETEEV